MLIIVVPNQTLEYIMMVEMLLTTWNQIRRELIVAAEIHQSMRITYLIENK